MNHSEDSGLSVLTLDNTQSAKDTMCSSMASGVADDTPVEAEVIPGGNEDQPLVPCQERSSGSDDEESAVDASKIKKETEDLEPRECDENDCGEGNTGDQVSGSISNNESSSSTEAYRRRSAKAMLEAASHIGTKDSEALATVAKRLTAAQPCKNECGFYGNPAQMGFCSVCYANYQRSMYSAVAGASGETAMIRPSGDTSKGQGSLAVVAAESAAAIAAESRSASHSSTVTTLKGGESSTRENKEEQQTVETEQSDSNRFSQLIQEEAGHDDGQDSGDLAEKLVQIARSSRVGDFLRKVETTLSSAFQGDNEGHDSNESVEETKQTYSFSDFLKAMREPAAQDLVVKTKKFIEHFQNGCDKMSTEQKVEEVQSFLQGMADDIASHPLWRRSSEAEIENSIDGIEKYVMTKLYNSVFLPTDTDDAVKDEELTKQIENFGWVVPRNMDIDISKEIDNVKYFLIAKKELNKVDSKRAPQDKLNCIVKCSKCLFHVLQLCERMKGKAASADEFLPLLIYLVLKTNPVRLHSNIQYLSRYCNTTKMISGEAGYYFTNMCCAVEYISKLSEDSLTKEIPVDIGLGLIEIPSPRHREAVKQGGNLVEKKIGTNVDEKSKVKEVNTGVQVTEGDVKSQRTEKGVKLQDVTSRTGGVGLIDSRPTEGSTKMSESQKKVTTLETLQEGLWNNMMKLKDSISSAIENSSTGVSSNALGPSGSTVTGSSNSEKRSPSPVKSSGGANLSRKPRSLKGSVSPSKKKTNEAKLSREEEEYQVQLAMALSLSLQEQNRDQEVAAVEIVAPDARKAAEDVPTKKEKDRDVSKIADEGDSGSTAGKEKEEAQNDVSASQESTAV